LKDQLKKYLKVGGFRKLYTALPENKRNLIDVSKLLGNFAIFLDIRMLRLLGILLKSPDILLIGTY